MKIRLLHLITDLEVGGAPLFVKNLVCGFDPSGFDVRVACLAPEGPLARELRARGIPTHCLGARGAWDIRVFYRLAGLINRFRPDILHCTLVHANVTGRLVGRFCNVPYIVATIQTAEQGKKWHLTAENLTCRLSDMTVCVSRSVFHHTRRFSNVPLSRLCVIPNAIDCDRFADARPVDPAKFDLPPDKINIIFVGRLDPVKNIDILIRAMKILSSRLNVQLLILGDGPQHDFLEQLTRDLHLSHCVRFIGPRRNVEQWLKSADIFVLPSKWEGLSLSALEAMAAGVPIVASRTAGLTDIIQNDKTGLLVPPGDVQGLSAAVSRLTSAPDLACRLARAAQEHVRRNFSLDAIVLAHTHLYVSRSTSNIIHR
jgi:glycosyltransferase involved in cell wall biosynthesis